MSTPQLTLPAESASVPAARRFVRTSLADLDARAAGADAEMLVSELATNAVLHARTPFTIEVSRNGARVRICVLDLSPMLPRTRDYGTDSTTGRGMRLLASLASDWGVTPQGTGKTVWFEVLAAGATETVPAWEDEVDLDALLASFGGDGEGDDGPRVLGMVA